MILSSFMKEKLKEEMLGKKVKERKKKIDGKDNSTDVMLTEPKSALSRFKKKKS